MKVISETIMGKTVESLDRPVSNNSEDEWVSQNLHLVEDLDLDPNSITVTSMKENECIVLHSTVHHKKMVVTANAVTRVSKGQIMVNLINLNDKRVSLNKGSKYSS